MAICRRYFPPVNILALVNESSKGTPHWQEITENLEPGQQPQDRLDLVSRVYRAKLRSLMDLLVKKKYFGDVAAYVHVTEFQKRGLPHEHILLIMHSRSKLTNPDAYDKHICAEILDKDKYPVLHELVIKHMLHGSCGVLNRKCPCMVMEPIGFSILDNFVRQHNKAKIHILCTGGETMDGE
jgi:hypothetical protein